MLSVHHTGDEVVAAYRELWLAASPHFLFVANAVEPAVAAELRARLAAAGTERLDVADRARYRWNDSLRVDELWSSLAAFASGLAATPLDVRAARWVHLARGDYALVKDDSRSKPPGTTVELTLDLSEAVTTESEIVYAEPDGSAREVPQLPGLLALVARTPATTRYERPLTHRAGGGEVVRLRLWLSPLASAAVAPPPAR
jgi:hypothetical protein